MPTILRNEDIEGYAHCLTPRCKGADQVQVPAKRWEEAYTFQEKGGDLPGFENSFIHVVFADEEDLPCPHCEKPREISDVPRPTYPNVSGQDPNHLLDMKHPDVHSIQRLNSGETAGRR